MSVCGSFSGRSIRGVTLLELLVGVTLSSLVMTLGLQAWKPASFSIFALRDHATAVGEMRIAVDALLADLGGAETALPTIDGALYVVREPGVARIWAGWRGGADPGILFHRDGDALLRSDLAAGTETIVADGLTGFEVVRIGGAETHLTLTTGEGDNARTLTLVWPL